MNLTGIQWLLISVSALGFIGGATAQLTDLFGPMVAKDIASAAAFLGGLLTTAVIPQVGQKAQIQNVTAMPGVERITVNENASQALAQVATDPQQPKIGAASADVRATLQQTAKGT